MTKSVVAASATIVQQCLNAGLLDEIHIDLVPFLLGDGVRLFDHLKGAPVVLDDPQVSIGKGSSTLRTASSSNRRQACCGLRGDEQQPVNTRMISLTKEKRDGKEGTGRRAEPRWLWCAAHSVGSGARAV